MWNSYLWTWQVCVYKLWFCENNKLWAWHTCIFKLIFCKHNLCIYEFPCFNYHELCAWYEWCCFKLRCSEHANIIICEHDEGLVINYNGVNNIICKTSTCRIMRTEFMSIIICKLETCTFTNYNCMRIIICEHDNHVFTCVCWKHQNFWTCKTCLQIIIVLASR